MNPEFSRIAKKILDARMYAMGTVCDGRKHEKTELSMKELRYKMAVAVIEDKMSCSRAVEKFGVSKGFVSKWLHIYRTRKLLDSKYKNRKMPMSVFNSISTRPIIRKFGRKAREAIIKLCNIKEYRISRSSRKSYGKSTRSAYSTIDKIQRQKGLRGDPPGAVGTRPTDSSSAP